MVGFVALRQNEHAFSVRLLRHKALLLQVLSAAEVRRYWSQRDQFYLTRGDLYTIKDWVTFLPITLWEASLCAHREDPRSKQEMRRRI